MAKVRQLRGTNSCCPFVDKFRDAHNVDATALRTTRLEEENMPFR